MAERPHAYTQIALERHRQDKLHGAGRTLPADTWFRILGEEVGEVAKGLNERDRENVMDELVQVAAVCVAWLESEDW